MKFAPGLLAALVAVPALAHAEPIFVELGADGAQTRVGTELALVRATGTGDTLERVAVNAQLMSPQHYGGYVSIAGGHLAQTGVGGLDLGGLFRGRASGLDVVVRVGIVVPTAPSAYYYDDRALAQSSATAAVHPADLAVSAPGVTGLRLAVSPMYARKHLFIRTELGIDASIGGNLKDATGSTIHAELGIGLARTHLAGTVELAAVRVHVAHGTDRMLGLAASVQYRAGRWLPYAAVTSLVGRDGYADPYVALVAGVRVRFSL